MLPEALLPYSLKDGQIVPYFFTEGDHPGLRALLDEFDRYMGRPQRELHARLREPLPGAMRPRKQKLAAHVIGRIWGSGQAMSLPPHRVRAALFLEAARSHQKREAVIAQVAKGFDVAQNDLEVALFADLPGERVVGPPTCHVSPAEIALRANLALAQGIIFRSIGVRISLDGGARAVVRHAKLRGLICTAERDMTSMRDGTVLAISGPYALFRRTLLYGKALGELLPLLVWCESFRLEANCVLRDQSLTLVLGSSDPIFPSAEPRRYDSAVEEHFASDFRREGRDWDVTREPEPVAAGGTLVFPDFALRHRVTGRRFLLEILGFWTPGYVERKLAQFREARLDNLILCIDADRNCAAEDLPPGVPVVRFRRRVDANAVLRIVEGSTARST